MDLADGLRPVPRRVVSCTRVHLLPSAALPPYVAGGCLLISHQSVSRRLSPVMVARPVAMASVIQAVL